MNPVLQDKLKVLEQAKDYECWYLVKQPTSFDSLCYLVSFLKEFKTENVSGNLHDFIGEKIEKLQAVKPEVEISNNYRALRVAAFFGLITMTSARYDEAEITEAFEEICRRCGGEFEKTDLYTDMIHQQIEKMYISSKVDEEYQGVRKEYRLYPVMLLYKILLELGRATGEYSITMTEYRYLVATTKVFEDFLDTLLLIKLLRADHTAAKEFDKYRMKFDNRLIQALKQLPTLEVERDHISLKAEKVSEVARKVYIFEKNPNAFTADDYPEFLGSAKSLFAGTDFDEQQDERLSGQQNCERDGQQSCDNRIPGGTNILLYGVPGSGKSWTIEHEYCRKDTVMERVVFHPDYTSSDFIGQILPATDENGQVRYEFAPGPFTEILREAYEKPEKEYVLIIEEINRGNAPVIFGEIFQLLDRKKEIKDIGDDGFPVGTSEYAITHTNIAEQVYKDRTHKVRIPSNLSLIGTMNTSDQNVFTLDTAFQRRWEMRLVENTFEYADRRLAAAEILDTGVTWETFCTEMNRIIIGNNARITSAEDKRLGVYFIGRNDLTFDANMGSLSDGEYDALRRNEQNGTISSSEKERLDTIRKAMKQNRKFPEKVLKYLWDDAFKFNRETVFETSEFPSLEQVIRAFLFGEKEGRFVVFRENVRDAFVHSNR